MPEVHWPRGGSNSDRILACPGSVEEAAKWPAGPSSEAAVDGTHSHTLLETCLVNGEWDAGVYVGQELQDHEGKFVVDEERAGRVQMALDYINTRVYELVGDGYHPVVTAEEFVDAGRKHGIPQWGGSADVTIDWGPGVEIVDYKDGGKPVTPHSNQLVTYMEGTRSDDHEVLRVTIVQPRVYTEPQTYVYTKDQFEQKLRPLVDSMWSSTQAGAPRHAGDHCTYCPGAAMGRCPEWSRLASETINAMVVNPDPPAVAAPAPVRALTLPGVGEHTPLETLTAILDAEPVVLGIIKEAKEEALRRAQAGEEVPGYAIQRTPGRRQYVKGAEDALKKIRVKKEVLYETKLKSPKQVTEGKAFKSLPEKTRDKILDLIEKPPGSLKLVPVGASLPPPPKDKTKALFADVAVKPEPLDFM